MSSHRVGTWAIAVVTAVGAPLGAQELGEPCDPDDATGRPGITCQATGDWDYRRPYIQNASKGDVLLSAGCGMIGGLLRQVSPPQRYSHSGIMVENRTAVRHSTAAEERYVVDADGDGLVPERLKYGWPGTITESIDEAYEGAYVVDPDNRTWFLASFNRDPVQCPEDPAVIFPAVVKPFVVDEVAVRDQLNAVAGAAVAISGHYRFYAYSNGALVGDSTFQASGEPAWADGTDGTVCSELVWSAARAAGVEVEDVNLEAGDRVHPTDASRRGLYLYTEAERLAAGRFIYDRIYNQFYEESGWWGRLFTDAPDDGANQVCNCFAFDWCGREEQRREFLSETDQTLDSPSTDGDHSKDSSEWEDPGVGIALSPDDLLEHWDRHPAGAYGHHEEMAYRPGSFRRIHRWARSEGTGDVVVSVVHQGNPVAGAEVRLRGFEPQSADAAGATTFVSIPGGGYEVEAFAKILLSGTPTDAQGSATVTVPAAGSVPVQVALSTTPWAPDASRFHREIRVSGTIFIRDHETLASDETDHHAVDETIVLDPATRPSHVFRISRCTGDEVRVEVDVTAQLDPADLSITLGARGELFEGTACDTDDDEDEAFAGATVVEDGSANLSIDLVNDTWNGDDRSEIRLVVTNARHNPS